MLSDYFVNFNYVCFITMKETKDFQKYKFPVAEAVVIYIFK